MEPVPLPEPQKGPGLFVMKEKSEQYEIFRRYLFDWRTSLVTPFHLLLNGDGHAIKVYANAPSSEQGQSRPGESRKERCHLMGSMWAIRIAISSSLARPICGLATTNKPCLTCRPVLRRTPDNARVLVLVGQIHLQANRLDEAEKSFRAAFAVNDQNREAWAGLADVYDNSRKRFRALNAGSAANAGAR